LDVRSPSPNEHADSSTLTEKICSFLQTVLRHETAVRAHDRWVAKGRPSGTAVHDWLEAEAELADLWALATQLAESNPVLREYIVARDRLQEALQATEQRSRQLHGLAEAALALNAATSLWELLQVLADRARAVIGAHLSTALFLPAGDWSKALRAESLSDKYTAYRDYDTPPTGAGIYMLAYEHGRPLRLTQAELEAHPRWRGFGAEVGRHPPLHGWLAAPLVGGDGQSLGLIQLSDRFEGEFTEEDELVLAQLAQLAAAATETRQTQETLETHVSQRTADLAQATEALRQEIAEHKRAKDALQENYALLQAMAEGTTDAVFAKDLEGRYLMINSAGARFLGKSIAAVLGQDDTALFSPETARHIMEHDRTVLASGRTQTFEDIGRAAGVTRTYLSTKGPFRDGQGNVIGLFGISRDITERKQLERRLRAEHAVTRALAESATLPEAAPRILEAICTNLGWDMGICWELDVRAEVLRCVRAWHAPGVAAPELEKTSRELTYSRGMGLPGQVWARGEPVWSADVRTDPKILYRGPVAHQEGLRAAIAFPVCSGGEFLGAVEIFSREMGAPDPALLDTMAAITSQVSQFMERKKVEKALHERQREFAIAREIQQGLLPKAAPQLPGVIVAGVSHAAQETGGDYFDFFPLADGALALAVGDASGHGIGAALLIAETRAYLRALALTHADLAKILALTNRRLTDGSAEDHFVTLLLARLGPGGRSLTYTSAGHWPGFVLDAHGRVKTVLESTGVVLGFDPAAEFPAAAEVPLELGDLVLLCTDGLAEAFSKEGVPFGRERVLELVAGRRHDSPARIVEALCQAAREFSGEQQMDDMTAVVVKVQ
jgi:PAS domain S-box-containing protein